MVYPHQFRLAPLLVAISAASGFSSAAYAQEKESMLLEEVVVTAQRQQTLLQETPIAVTVFSQEQIQDLGIFTVADINALAPNTNIQKQPSSNSNMSIFIRGVGSGETALMVDPKVSFYIDGVYMSKTVGGVFDIVDMQSIEVLRGPQGTLFGRNSTGGAINVTTVKPKGELAVKLAGSIGNDGYQRLTASVDTPKMFDMLSAKISGIDMQYDGWANNDYPGQEEDLASQDNNAYRIALRLEPMDNLTIDYTYDKTDNEGVPAPFQITEVKSSLYNGITETPFPFTYLGGQLYQEIAANVGDPKERREDYSLDYVSTEKLKVDGNTLTIAWELQDFTLKYIYADRNTDSTYARTDLDSGVLYASDLFYGEGAVIQSPAFHAQILAGSIDMTTNELQMFGNLFDDKLSYTLGYYHYKEDVEQNNPQTFSLPIQFLVADPGLLAAYTGAGYCSGSGSDVVCIGSQRLPLPFPAPGADPNMNGFVDFVYGQTTKSWAAYGQATYSLTDALDATVGIRYTEDERDGYLFNESLNMISIADQFTNKDDWNNTSYMATLNYAVNPDMNVYASYSTGYNAGGFNARAASASSWDNPVDEETIGAFEIGLKADWLDSRLRTNIAVFYNEVDDAQIAQFEAGSGGASSALVNAGEATFQGVELDLLAILTEELSLDVTYGYLDAEFGTYEAIDPATDQIVDVSGITTVPRAPENTAAIGLQYDFSSFSFADVSARFEATYLDSVTFSAINNQYDSAEAHWLMGARVSLNNIQLGDSGALRISAWGKNLADEEYREWGIDFGSLGYAGVVFGAPRSYGIDVVYTFGG